MASLNDLVAYLDGNLKTGAIADYPGAMNGLQLANNGRIDRIIAAVDASLPVIKAAAEERSALLIVHHGMFWQGAQPITGSLYEKLRIAMEANLAIYSSHLPLDVHPEWGNNIQLAKAIGIENPQPFYQSKNLEIGLRGTWQGSREALAALLSATLGEKVHVCPGGPDQISSVGLITGGAGSEVGGVAAAGVDTFITGEGPHWSYPLAEECGINLFYCGHYATETSGVKAVAKALGTTFGLPERFLHHPSGL